MAGPGIRYGFGWESQLLETAFLAAFAVPFWSVRSFPVTSPPPLIPWLYRWLGVRVMLGTSDSSFTSFVFYEESFVIPAGTQTAHSRRMVALASPLI